MKSIHEELLPKSNQKDNDQTKELILENAEKLYKKYGCNGISMNDLAAESGISKNTIYEFFVGKAELFDCIVSNQISSKKKELDERKRVAENPIQEAFIAWHIIDDFV